MLKHLHIRNYALIKELDIDFAEGLSTITGETGAGKSIIFGALGLLSGQRADTGVIKMHDQKCVIEGVFVLHDDSMRPFFEQAEIDFDTETVLRREITPQGKSRAFINDTPVNLALMRELSEQLIHIHGQHHFIQLSDPVFQISVLDTFADTGAELSKYQDAYENFKRANRHFRNLTEESDKAAADFEYNSFQLKELSDLALGEHEQHELEKELALLSNADQLIRSLSTTREILAEGEENVLASLTIAAKELSANNAITEITDIRERLDSTIAELDDIATELNRLQNQTQSDSGRLQFVEERLATIHNVMTRHRLADYAAYSGLLETYRQKVSIVENMEAELSAASTERANAGRALKAAGAALSQKRIEYAPEFGKRLSAELKEVGIPEARLIIQVEPADKPATHGMDTVRFLFSANKGIEPAEVGNVASGGEMSRIMLTLRYIHSESLPYATIVFDEIDTGISGQVSIKVGAMLHKMAQGRQIITITHQPQVAARGNQQFLVYKQHGEEFTATHIRPLSSDERVTEIAKMISGYEAGPAALENARQLLAGN